MGVVYSRVAFGRPPTDFLQLRKSQPRHSWRLGGDEMELTNPAAEHSLKQQAFEIYCLGMACLTASTEADKETADSGLCQALVLPAF